MFKFDFQASTISTWLLTILTCPLWDQLPRLLMEWGRTPLKTFLHHHWETTGGRREAKRRREARSSFPILSLGSYNPRSLHIAPLYNILMVIAIACLLNFFVDFDQIFQGGDNGDPQLLWSPVCGRRHKLQCHFPDDNKVNTEQPQTILTKLKTALMASCEGRGWPIWPTATTFSRNGWMVPEEEEVQAWSGSIHQTLTAPSQGATSTQC